jgi:uncharacterized protein (DUF4415 family)
VSKANISKTSQTDWKRVAATKDNEIDYSEISELGDEFFAKAALVWPPEKRQLSIRLDTDVIEWFKEQGGRYQTRINAVLRKYMEVHKR